MTSSLTMMATDGTVCPLLKSGRDGCLARFDRSLYQLSLSSGDDVEKVDLGFSGSRVLERLLQVPGEVVSREELLSYAWQDRVVGQGSLNQQIYTLRQVLGDADSQIIQTLPRRGYLFNPNYLVNIEKAPLSPVPTAIEQPITAPAQRPPQMPQRSAWFAPTMLGTAVALFLACVALGYRFMHAPKGSLTYTHSIGQLEVLYVEKSQQMLDRMMQETRLLVASVAGMSSRPGRLIVNMSPGFYELRCLQNDGRINWLKVHRSQVNAIPNETLQGCLR